MAKVRPSAGDTEDVPLLKFESGMFGTMGEAITTFTFMKTGDWKAAAEVIKARLQAVAEANPWICGTPVRDKAKHGKLLALRFSTGTPVIDSIFEINETLKISDDMDYVALAKEINKSSANLPTGGKVLKAGMPISKMTVAPTPSGFAMIFSMTHMCANGGTYYTLYNMLSEEGKVFAMDPVRKQESHDKIPEFVGKAHHAFMIGSLGNTLNSVGAIMCGKKATAYCFLVDEDKLQVAKEKAAATPLPDGMKLSTNDMLTSGFANITKPRLLTMAMDFKMKLPGMKKEDAGNYHAGIILDSDGYGQPGSVRQAVSGPPPCSRAALPGCCGAMCCKLALITSWAGFLGISIPGCEQTMHCPCIDIGGMMAKAMDGVCIVFNPTPGRTAMLLLSKTAGSKEFMDGLPLAGPLSPKLWPVRD